MLHLLQANIFATQLVAQDNTCTRYAHVLQHVFYIYCKRALLLHNCCAGQQLLYMLMQTETIATQFLRCTTPYLACRATICTGGNRIFLPHGQSNSYGGGGAGITCTGSPCVAKRATRGRLPSMRCAAMPHGRGKATCCGAWLRCDRGPSGVVPEGRARTVLRAHVGPFARRRIALLQ